MPLVDSRVSDLRPLPQLPSLFEDTSPSVLCPNAFRIQFNKHVFVEFLVCGREKQAHRVSTVCRYLEC